MSEKNVNTRIIHKHDTEINWSKATNFIPKQGEIIIYDKDDNYNYERIKVGDGATLVNNLPFYGSSIENILDGIANGSVRTSSSTTESTDYKLGTAAFAEGSATKASGNYSHAEGYSTTASGAYSHAEGRSSTASGSVSHAEGTDTVASGIRSHASGWGTIAKGQNQTAIGKYNVEDTNEKYALIVGNGTSTARSNAFTVDWSGNAEAGGKKLATETYVEGKIAGIPTPDVSGQIVEQIATHNTSSAAHNDIRQSISEKANGSDLTSHTGNSTVHITADERAKWNGKSDFSGSYNDLSDKPTIPTAYTHPATHPASMITGLSTVATSGSYADLTNKPTIPTVTNDLTNALKSNYDTAYTHSQSAHAPSNAQVNADITKAEIEAKLTGDITTHTHSQYLTEHQDISGKANVSGQVFTGTVEAPVVKATSYFYTPTLVNEGDLTKYYHRLNLGYAKHDYWEFHEYGGDYRFYKNTAGTDAGKSLIANITSTGSNFVGQLKEGGVRVYSPNNKPTAADLGITIPNKTSQLTNDSGYLTSAPVTSVDGSTGAITTNAVKYTAQSLTNTQKTQARTNIGAGTGNGNCSSIVKSNVSVATSAWVSSNTYSNYPYQASITVSGCTSNHVPEVVFSPTDVSSGIFAPVCSSTTNAVIIYATKKPSAAITILTVECRKAL